MRETGAGALRPALGGCRRGAPLSRPGVCTSPAGPVVAPRRGVGAWGHPQGVTPSAGRPDRSVLRVPSLVRVLKH